MDEKENKMNQKNKLLTLKIDSRELTLRIADVVLLLPYASAIDTYSLYLDGVQNPIQFVQNSAEILKKILFENDHEGLYCKFGDGICFFNMAHVRYIMSDDMSNKVFLNNGRTILLEKENYESFKIKVRNQSDGNLL